MDIEFTHILTNQKKEENSKEKERIAKLCTETGYLRYGELPKNGRSRNYATGELEEGVSCFNARFSPDNKYYMIKTETPPLQIDALVLSIKCDKAYRLWGDRVGTGSDGEPLLKVKKKLEILRYKDRKDADESNTDLHLQQQARKSED